VAESLFMACENNPISRPSVEVSLVYVGAVVNEVPVKQLSDTTSKQVLSVTIGNDMNVTYIPVPSTSPTER
jgi:hypothetical protein